MRGTECGGRSGTSAGRKAKVSAGTHAQVLPAANKERQRAIAEHHGARANVFCKAQHYVLRPGGEGDPPPPGKQRRPCSTRPALQDFSGGLSVG